MGGGGGAGANAGAGVGKTMGAGITVGGYIQRTSKKMAMWRTTNTQTDPRARPSISQMSIVLDLLFLGHNSTHLFKVKGCSRVSALTPPAGCVRVLCVGNMFYVVDARQHSDGIGTLRKQKCVPCSLKELEHASVDIDAAKSRVEVLCFDGLSLGLSPRGWGITAPHLHSLLY